MAFDLRRVRDRIVRTVSEQARAITRDPDAVLAIVQQATGKLATDPSAPLRRMRDRVHLMLRLARAWADGSYREIPPAKLLVVVGAIVYFVSPLDLVPDFLPGGLGDDAAIIALVLRTVADELDRFEAWEQLQPIDVRTIDR